MKFHRGDLVTLPWGTAPVYNGKSWSQTNRELEQGTKQVGTLETGAIAIVLDVIDNDNLLIVGNNIVGFVLAAQFKVIK